MKVVIDVGCARYGGDFSVERLIDLYHPDHLYGFDPALEAPLPVTELDGTTVELSAHAAWICGGKIDFFPDGLNSQTRPGTHHSGWRKVPCFDLARFVHNHSADELILKLDVEGAEYLLLPHLIHHDADRVLSLAVVEWHTRDATVNDLHLDPERRRAEIESQIRCPLEEWNW